MEMTTEVMEAKKLPAENKNAAPKVTDTGGKEIKSLSQTEIASAATSATPPVEISKEAAIALARAMGFKNPELAAEGLIAQATQQKRKEEKDDWKAVIEADKAKLLEIHSQLKDAILPIIAEAGIELTNGKRIIIHGGVSDAELFDISYPEPLPDTTRGKTKGGGNKVRNAVVMGAVQLRVPELGISREVAPSLSAFYRYWTGSENHGFA